MTRSSFDDVHLETDAHFNDLGPQGEKALGLVVGLMPHFGAGHPDLLRKRMLFRTLGAQSGHSRSLEGCSDKP